MQISLKNSEIFEFWALKKLQKRLSLLGKNLQKFSLLHGLGIQSPIANYNFENCLKLMSSY